MASSGGRSTLVTISFHFCSNSRERDGSRGPPGRCRGSWGKLGTRDKRSGGSRSLRSCWLPPPSGLGTLTWLTSDIIWSGLPTHRNSWQPIEKDWHLKCSQRILRTALCAWISLLSTYSQFILQSCHRNSILRFSPGISRQKYGSHQRPASGSHRHSVHW